MTDLRIRNVDDWVLDVHRRHAKQQGTTLENEAREILTAAALAKKQKLAEEHRAALQELRDKHGTLPDSTPGIREERERRG
jgi:plasmid stability protein